MSNVLKRTFKIAQSGHTDGYIFIKDPLLPFRRDSCQEIRRPRRDLEWWGAGWGPSACAGTACPRRRRTSPLARSISLEIVKIIEMVGIKKKWVNIGPLNKQVLSCTFHDDNIEHSALKWRNVRNIVGPLSPANCVYFCNSSTYDNPKVDWQVGHSSHTSSKALHGLRLSLVQWSLLWRLK